MNENSSSQVHLQSVEEVREQRLSIPTKAIFGFGDWLNTITYGMIGAFLMIFCTDTLLLPTAAVTLLLSVSKLWDAVNDPIIGAIIDKSRSKWGVYRPWLLFGSVPFAIVGILVFAPIGGWSQTGKLVYLWILYCTYMVVFTIYHIAYGALGGAMTQNTDDRGSLYSYRLGTSQLLYWMLSSTFLIMVSSFVARGMRQDTGYFLAAAIYILPGIFFAALLFSKSKEVVAPPKSTKLPASQLWQFVIRNAPLLMCMAGQFVCGIYMYGRSTVMMYYFTYYAGNANLYSLYSFISIGCGIAGPFSAQFIMAKLGNKGKCVALGTIGSGLLFALMYFVNCGTQPVLFYILAGISGYFNGLVMASVYAAMLDTIEYGQYKTKVRAGAFAVSLCHFANKLGMTIIIALIGVQLTTLGYIANQAQNDAVLKCINGWFTLYPGIIGIIIGLIFLFCYKLDRNTYYDILQKLKAEQQSEQ